MSLRVVAALAFVSSLVGCGPAPYSLDPEPPPQPAPVVVPAAPAVLYMQQQPGVLVAPVAAPGPDASMLATLRSHHPALRACYEKARRRNPELRGQVVMRLMIDDDGDVDEVYDHGSDLPSRKAIECMREVYEDIQFSRQPARTSIVYPLYFAPDR